MIRTFVYTQQTSGISGVQVMLKEMAPLAHTVIVTGMPPSPPIGTVVYVTR